MAKWTNKQDTQIAIPQNTYSTSKYMMATIQLAKSEYYLPTYPIHSLYLFHIRSGSLSLSVYTL